MREDGSKLKRVRSRRYLAETIKHADYAGDLTLL